MCRCVLEKSALFFPYKITNQRNTWIYLSSNCRELKNTNRTKLIIKVVTRHQTGCYPAICSVTSMNVDWRSFLALGRSFTLILYVFLYHLQQNITKKWFMQMPHPYPANWSCHQWSHRIVSCSWVAERQWLYAVTAQRFTNNFHNKPGMKFTQRWAWMA